MELPRCRLPIVLLLRDGVGEGGSGGKVWQLEASARCLAGKRDRVNPLLMGSTVNTTRQPLKS
ncbi:hypothetical protein [Geitlerinema sp. PCC 9228]|uniref:hypothetical protein n=1 Tax=Geitlerinema sp. PCC 9228 TaxID=111611 RepID=UPI000AEBA152|nr:hypothetical protein [Geitlerinema sp. PCC 9228]